MRDDLTVPGESVPILVALALTLGGSACAFAATLWYQEHPAAVVARRADPATVLTPSIPIAPASATITASATTPATPVTTPTKRAPSTRIPPRMAPATTASPAPVAPASALRSKPSAPASDTPATPARPRATSIDQPAMCLLGVAPFDRGLKRPAKAGQEMLTLAQRWLLIDSKRRLLLRGHSDAGGTDGYNLRLSAARARWIRNWLLERGIAPERVTAQAFGEYLPVVGARPDDARQRRVEMFGIGGRCDVH